MTQFLVMWSLLVGVVGLLWVLGVSIVHDNRVGQHKKARTI